MKQEKSKVFFQAAALFLLIAAGVSGYLFSFVPWMWQALLGLSVACMAATIWTSRQSVRHQLSRRTTRYGLNSLFMSLVVFAIVVVLNLIATNHDQKFDLTKNKLHTLSDQTVKVLKGLTREVRLRAFVSPMQLQDYNEIFDKYAHYSKHIKKEFVDVDKDPLSVRRYDIKQAGTIIVESDTRSSKVEGISGADDPNVEAKLTNAIIQVEKGSKKKIYFVNGHGERLVGDSGREGYSELRQTLSSGRFDVEELNLLEKDKIPADAEILVIPGPKKDFMTQEFAQLDEYVRNGGKLLVLLEPDSPKSLKPFLAKYGVNWNERRAVLERNKLQQLAGGNPLTPIVSSYDGSHEITREARQMSIFPVATPVEKAATVPEGLTVSVLFSTSPRSQEVVFQGDRVAVDEKKDRKGPLTLGLAISGKAKTAAPKTEKKEAAAPEDKPKEYRVVVVGDADFASNALKNFGLNLDLFQNMLSWLSEEEDLISIRPKPTDESNFDITEQRIRVINLASVMVLPFAMFLTGIMVWLKRRRL